MRKQFFRSTLLRMAVITLIPLLAMGIFSIAVTDRYIAGQNQEIEMKSLIQVRAASDTLFLDIKSIDAGISASYGVQIALRRILSHSATSYYDVLAYDLTMSNLVARVAANPILHSMYLYHENTHGRFFTSEWQIADPQTFRDGAWLELIDHTTRGTNYWSLPRKIKMHTSETATVEVVSYIRNMFWQGGTLAANISVKEVNQLLTRLESASSQGLAIMNQERDLLFSSNNFALIPEEIVDSLRYITDDSAQFGSYGNAYRLFQVYSPDTELYYLSIIPENEFNILSRQIILITILLLIAAISLTMLFAVRTTRQSYNLLYHIFDMLDATADGAPIPEPYGHSDDIYGTIASNIIRNFIERNYLKEQLERNKYQNQALELMALQSQMNPHFLFNSLDTIYWRTMALTQRPNETTELIEWLSDMLKYSLSQHSSIVTINDEILNTQNFINIQQIRYNERFQAFWRVDPEALDCPIIRMLLQPLAENCLTHAMIQDKPLAVRIRIRKTSKECIKISVTDNGRGIDKERLAEIRQVIANGDTMDSHIGLFNTNKRIMITYGPSVSFKVLSKEGFGTVIYLEYPFGESRLS